MKSYIAEILRTLGATPCYRGFTALVYAICLVVEDESRLDNAMRDVYFFNSGRFELRRVQY